MKEVTGMEQGIVKWFDVGKGVGIIRSQNGEDVTVHLAAITASGLKGLHEGQAVRFKLVKGPNGPEAIDVRLL
jgi:cold shock protein